MDRKIALPAIFTLLLAAACQVGEAPSATVVAAEAAETVTAADVALHRLAKAIGQVGDEEIMHCRAGLPYAATQAGDRTHDFGEELYGLTTEPGFVAGWAMLVAQEEEEEEGPKPKKCRGKGIGFARCVKGHLDAGLKCSVWKDDDSGDYVAECTPK